MSRRLGLLLVVVGALAIASAAVAAYPTPFAVQGGNGLVSNDGSLRFVALKAGSDTTISATRTEDGTAWKSQAVKGAFGIPMLTQNGLLGGLFRDGSTLVLQSVGQPATTRFLLVDTKDLSLRKTIALKGYFGFDALSPNGSRLYLIQHMSSQDLDHYVVRAYDLNAGRLLSGRIADKTQKSWVMQGFAVNRATSDSGRWVYTLYMNPGGYPFIHALDTVRGVAHCIGLPWRAANQGPVFDFQLSLKDQALTVKWKDGRIYRIVDTRTWRLSKGAGA